MHIGKVLLAVTPLQRADFWAPKARPLDSPKPGRLLPILTELPSQAMPGAGAPVSPRLLTSPGLLRLQSRRPLLLPPALALCPLPCLCLYLA